ncbi:MAG: TRAP transporter substrate-binding protein DctP [Desulfatibacillaceae bacterium]|nr:TRAP transporter substrate-binding protein DctP [Desulfatibacillaceae bacterium]
MIFSKKRFCFLLAVIFLASALFAQTAAAEEKILWRTASLAPKDMGYAVYVRDILFPALTNACDGNLVWKAYWGGVMGNDTQAIQNIRIGRLHASGLSGEGTFLVAPEATVLGLPFLLNDYDETDYLKEKMIDSFDAVVAPRGFKILAWLDQGFDETYSVHRPLKTLADFQGVRFATWFGPLEGKLLQRLGASPTPLQALEIPPSLRSGVVEAVIAPSIWVVGTQLYTRLRYMNNLKMRYSPGFWLLSLDAFKSIPEQYQKNIDGVRLQMAQEFNNLARLDLVSFQDAMIQYGLAKVESSPADIREIRRRATPIWYELAGELFPSTLLDEVLGHLADYRSSQMVATAPTPEPAASPVRPQAVETARIEEAVAQPVAPAAPAPAAEAADTDQEFEAILYDDTPADDKTAQGLSWTDDARTIGRVQLMLQALNFYKMVVDGIMGPVTYQGVQRFRSEFGLGQGIVDEALIRTLENTIKASQQRLAALGFYKLAVDGVPGPATYRAVTEFQQQNNLPASGRLDRITLEALGVL